MKEYQIAATPVAQGQISWLRFLSAWLGGCRISFGERGQITNRLGILIYSTIQVLLLSGFSIKAAEPMVAGGYNHVLYLADDGTVWAWGSNINGQLGCDPVSTTILRKPQKVSGLSNVVAISAGYLYSLALTVDGKVYAWGYNYNGQLGQGTKGIGMDNWHPTLVKGLPASGIKAIAGGYYHALALDGYGRVWGWGENGGGQLATGDYSTPKSTAILITTPARIRALAAGHGHSLALSDFGTVYGWGQNGYGQLGDNTTTSRPTVAPVTSLANIVSISAGYFHSTAVAASGSGYAWGYNTYGQLGNGSYSDSHVPVSCGGVFATRLIAVANTTIMLRCNSYISTWGDNSYGQCGSPKSTLKFNTLNSPGFTCRSGMVSGHGAFTQLIGTDGVVRTFGANTSGAFGIDSDTPTDSNGPRAAIAIWPLSRIISTAMGQYHTTAVKSDGTVWSWGYNANGQAGDGTGNMYKLTPVPAAGVSGVVCISAGGDYGDHTVALTGNGSVYSWGRNNYGETGDGTFTTPRTTPSLVSLSGVARAIAAGDNHSLVVDGYGNVKAWGADATGALGDDAAYADKSNAVSVAGLANVVGVAAGGGSSGIGCSLALRADGTVWSWGSGNYGQLGNGASTNRPTPGQVSGLTGVVAIVAGSYHALALKSDGTVWSWGMGSSGQLGNGANIYSSTPVQVVADSGANKLANIRAVGAGDNHSFAIDAMGNVYAWGNGGSGQFGNGGTISSNRPVVTGWSNACTIEGGYIGGTATLADGTVRCWGNNSTYQLGTGTTFPNPTLSPVQPLAAWLPYVSINVSSSSLTAFESGSVPATVTVARNGLGATATSSAGSLTVNITSGAGSTAAEGDYTLSPVTIAAGQMTAILIVTPITNHIAEDDTTVVPTLQPGGSDYNLGTNQSATVMIHNGDVAGVSLSAAPITVYESNSVPAAVGTGSTASVTALLRSDPVGTVMLNLSNTRPDKCRFSTNQLTFTGGTNGTWQSGVSFQVAALNNYIADGNQSFVVVLQVRTNSTDWQNKYRQLADIQLNGTCVDDLSGSVCAPLGTPVSWLWTYGLSNVSPAAAECMDDDHDGMLTWQEYVAGTNPTNAVSVQQIVSISSNSVVFSPALTNRNYAVFCITNLSGNSAEWLMVAPFQSSTGTIILPPTNVTTMQQMYYRVGVRVP